MIKITTSGNTKKTDSFLDAMIRGNQYSNLEKFGQQGVEALRTATPFESGKTAESWSYEIVRENGFTSLWWRNTNVINGFNVAVGLRYGHGTGSGGWVQGYDYIEPALRPIFDRIADAVWKEVTNA